MPQYTGTLQLNESTPAEQTLKEITITKATEIKSIWIFGEETNIVYTARLYRKDEGGTYRLIRECVLPSSQSFDFLSSYYYGEGPPMGFGRNLYSIKDVKITLESGEGGAGNVEVSYEIEYANLVKFTSGAVWVDADSGVTGTDEDKGTAENPVNDMNDAITIANLYKIHRFYIKQGSGNTTLNNNKGHFATYEGINSGYFGAGGNVFAIDGYRYNPTYKNLSLSHTGEHDYDQTAIRCCIQSNYDMRGGWLQDCVVKSGMSLKPNGSYAINIKNTQFNLSAIDMTNFTTGVIILDGCTGNLSITNFVTAGTIKIFSKGGLKLTIAASCTALATIEVHGPIDELINGGTSTLTVKRNWYVKTKSAIENIIQTMYGVLAGKKQFANTGAGDNHIEMKVYDFDESALVKTVDVLKPAGTVNTQTLDTNAMAGTKES